MADNDPLQLDPALMLPQTQLPNVTIQDLSKYFQQGPPIPQTVEQPQQSAQQQRTGRQPASIRYNNPGAMWPQASASKFGSTSHGQLADGNKIAYFDTPEAGAAAQFDLLASPKYAGMPIGNAIDKWSGHTGGAAQVSAYANSVAKSIGVSPGDILDANMLRSPAGIAFAKTMARQEAGVEYPMSDDQWKTAQRMAFGDIAQANAPAQAQTVADAMRSLGSAPTQKSAPTQSQTVADAMRALGL
jgi:hypothetical protein